MHYWLYAKFLKRSCPFCQSRELAMHDVGTKHFLVRCKSCCAIGPPGNTPQEAVDLWNSSRQES